MNTNSKWPGITLDLKPNTSAHHKMRIFFGHYDLRIYLSEGGYIDVGRGSFDAAMRIDFTNKGFSGCIGTVGQFCDSSASTILFGGLEHRNDLPVNVIMASVPIFMLIASKNEAGNLTAKEPQPFNIGNAVVLSADTKVLSGTNIGDGTLLAASAVASGNIDSFSIYGGVPAKKLKDRVPEQTKAALAAVQWWNFDTAYLANNLSRLQELAVDEKAAHIYRRETPRFVIKLLNQKDDNGEVQILGFLQDSEIRPVSEAPQRVQDYVNQINRPGLCQWVPDIWNI